MKLGYEHQDTYGETFFHTLYRIYFSHSYRIEKSAVQVYISPFYLLLKMRTRNRLVNDLTRPETQRELNLIYQLHVQRTSKADKILAVC
jgi:hypothetical protein